MSNQPLKIGLTGGIASGKSSVSQIFAANGIDIIDADKIARELFDDGSSNLEYLRDHFGEQIFTKTGSLDRKALGAIVFADDAQLAWLNNFTHPLVHKEMLAQIRKAESNYIILDIPLLVNSKGSIPDHLKTLIDRVLVIDVALETQLKRLLDRDSIALSKAKDIIRNQSTREQKLRFADDIVDNNSHIDKLRPQVEKLMLRYNALASSHKR